MSAARPLAFALALSFGLLCFGPPAFAQNTATLNTKAEKLQAEFVRGAVDLASEYEKAGDPAAAIALLERVGKVLPENRELQQKLDDLQNDVLSADETTLTIDASNDWTPIAQVRKGAAYRLAAAGSYRISMSGNVTIDGVPPGDNVSGLTDEAPLGALIGAYVDPQATRGRPSRDRKKNQPKIFRIKSDGASDRTADETGLLVVRLNLPEGARASGKIRVLLSGQIEPLDRR